MKGRTADRVGAVLSGLLERLEFRERLREYAVWNVWEEVVGDVLASKTEPIRIEEGKLVIRVANSTWMQEIQYLKDDIRIRLNRRLGGPIVRDLYLILGRVKRKKEGTETVTVHPVDESAIAALVPETGHPTIEAAIRRAVRARARRLGPE